MKQILFLALIVITILNLPLSGKAQNLVPNNSFEVVDSCPYNPYQLYFASPWFIPTYSSPDLFNACAVNPTVGVPVNGLGTQEAHTGVGYAGLITYYDLIPTWKEYISVPLTDSLQHGKRYCCTFYVSLADSFAFATDQIGAYFSADSILSSIDENLNVMPQVVSPVGNYITDTVNWIEVSGDFIAQGGEKILTIGNFIDSAALVALQVNNTQFNFAYYYVDDVDVHLCDSDNAVNSFTFFELVVPSFLQPSQSLWQIQNLPANTEAFIYNSIGQLVFRKSNYANDFDFDALPAGVYFYQLQLQSGEMRKGKIVYLR